MRPLRGRAPAGAALAGAVLAGTVLAGVAGGGPAAAAGALRASWSFDTPVGGGYRDSSGGGHGLRAVARYGGRVAAVSRPPGRAVAFPARCPGACARAILQTPHAASLNPGTARIRWGGLVRLARGQAGGGQNLVQKGYADRGGQYKLQVDGAAGRPSCAVVGTGAGRTHLALAAVSVADGAWHGVQCGRSGTALVIWVDGVPRGRARVPAGLAIRPTAPVRLGGKGVSLGNDQFHGALDHVWIRIG
ncbi:LamG-like jellyroll fold domain-containing protein [Pilimelia terevasa]|nr:LamG-like jellyroll fold domain-containing protein [Pilimelia terevasa]